ncbi:hypothetical protein [Moorena sp. SIO4G3]|uniref:hypothetical protein n=1 Tax=Moorena sp. SIO4G3 TaxID=2607821 RepID=UPI00142B2B2F|nr:hypothetical protein [Moorena sp. SIO4G3]NEO77363.1 hypothetical protein [Moorena sp. SIO4G3]
MPIPPRYPFYSYRSLPIPHSPFPTPDSLRCAFRRRIKFATGRTAPYSLLPTDL